MEVEHAGEGPRPALRAAPRPGLLDRARAAAGAADRAAAAASEGGSEGERKSWLTHAGGWTLEGPFSAVSK